ncbi:MAG: uncharacterized protein PWP45_77 [Tepidanaerobacteraceae bacterium]|nr:uncharacterized protein [Tepidanaerobacteraceae bacterium]
MNLSEKLQRFIKEGSQGNKSSCESERTDELNRVSRLLGGKIVATPYGNHVAVEKVFEGHFCHAGVRLSSVLEIPAEAVKLAAKKRDDFELDIRKTVFIDTETTSLAGGSGTYAFLIGVGYFEGNYFKLVQYFMNDFDGEPAVLYSLKKLFSNFEGLVSFNGKAYDIPLLSTRFLINRMENPLEFMNHFDLFHGARRIFGERLESLSLSSLEQNLFRMERSGDVPGFEIPSIYFKYLRDKNPFPLKPVFYHNQLDILSMVSLMARIGQVLKDSFNSGTCSGQDFYCLGRLYEDMGMLEESIRCYTLALSAQPVKDKAYRQLSLLYKKMGRWSEAEKLWIQMAKEGINRQFALIELSKLYEHRMKDYEKAASAAREALEVARDKKRLLGRSFDPGEIDEIRRRLERISFKMSKNREEQVKII